jgi:hypothetical protein
MANFIKKIYEANFFRISSVSNSNTNTNAVTKVSIHFGNTIHNLRFGHRHFSFWSARSSSNFYFSQMSHAWVGDSFKRVLSAFEICYFRDVPIFINLTFFSK